MSLVDVDQVTDLVQDVAERLIVPRFQALAHGDVREKARGELVTVADIEAELEIARVLEQVTPGVPVLGEEAAAADPGLAARVQAAPRYWLLDPLDGTANFVAGNADLGTMLALVEDGVAVAAWIWQPIHRALFVAEAGSGAFHDGMRIRQPPARAWNPSRAAGYARTTFFTPATADRIHAAGEHLGSVSPGPRAACITYPHLATGVADFAMFGRTHPWDHAPGALVVTEAGGAARRFDGTTYAPGQRGRGLLITSDANHWDPLGLVLGVADLALD